MFELISSVLAWFYSLTHSYAGAIALFTLVVMVLVTPLTLKATKGMLEMQRIQPEVKRIQEQFKGDRQRINEETMALFKEHKVNPLGGCLPLLLQAPIFIVIYQVLRGVTRECTSGLVSKGICKNVGTFAPDYVGKGSDLFKDLYERSEMRSFGLDLSKTAASIVSNDVVRGIPYVLLVLLVAGLSYFQQWQISSRNTSTTINRQQQMIMKVIPGAVAVFQLIIPAGLIFYFLVQSCYRIVQNFYITKKFYGPHGPAAQARAAALAAGTSKPAKAAAVVERAPKPNRPAPSRSANRPAGAARPAPSGTATTTNGAGGRPTPRAGAGGKPSPTPPGGGGRAKPAPRPRPSATAKPKPKPKQQP